VGRIGGGTARLGGLLESPELFAIGFAPADGFAAMRLPATGSDDSCCCAGEFVVFKLCPQGHFTI